MNQLHKAILSTVGYFDLLNYPLTAAEIHKWLFCGSNYSIGDVVFQLSELSDKISTQDGLYFLSGREETIFHRHDNYLSTIYKNKIVHRWSGLLAHIPGIRMIAVCNNFSFNNLRENSDIDFFVVAKSGRLYLVRFLLTAVTSIIGLRRHGSKIANRFCLSFYLDDRNLNLESIKVCPEDIYLKYWINTVLPVYDDGVYNDFCRENSWLDQTLANNYSYRPGTRRRVDLQKMYFKKFCEYLISGSLGDFLEKFLKKIQLAKMSKNKISLARENDRRVIISDHMLKFHERDRRQEYSNKFKDFIVKHELS